MPLCVSKTKRFVCREEHSSLCVVAQDEFCVAKSTQKQVTCDHLVYKNFPSYEGKCFLWLETFLFQNLNLTFSMSSWWPILQMTLWPKVYPQRLSFEILECDMLQIASWQKLLPNIEFPDPTFWKNAERPCGTTMSQKISLSSLSVLCESRRWVYVLPRVTGKISNTFSRPKILKNCRTTLWHNDVAKI